MPSISHLIALVVGIVANAGANVLIKAAMRHEKEPEGVLEAVLALVRNPWFLAGVGAFAVALICYAHALRRIDLSLGYPVMTGVGLVLVAAVSAWWFGEGIGPTRLAGMACILIGVVLLFRSPSGAGLAEASGPGLDPDGATRSAPVESVPGSQAPGSP